ncbi:MAG TPA: hypothetical protein VIH99_01145 [Bdellovibrionota bacterium]|jgi:hypothetical protein
MKLITALFPIYCISIAACAGAKASPRTDIPAYKKECNALRCSDKAQNPEAKKWLPSGLPAFHEARLSFHPISILDRKSAPLLYGAKHFHFHSGLSPPFSL